MLERSQRLCSLRNGACISRAITLPSFLLPAFQSPSFVRNFSASERQLSKIGQAPLSIPPEVSLRVIEPSTGKAHARRGRNEPQAVVEVEGPLGKLSMPIPPYMSVTQGATVTGPTLSVLDKSERRQREMWGTIRAYLQNHILGVSEGHTTIIRLVGVGYRASVEPTAITKTAEYPGQEFVSLKVGYSHPIELGVPQGVKASTPQPTRILLQGIEKEVVNQFAAKIRMWRKPEPYKGKGIFVGDETIRLKAKKIK